MSAPLVSVILPFYQPGQILNDAIRSIIAQTFRDFELILVNNNADRESQQIACNWQEKDNRIKLIHEPIQGISFALNKGLSQAKGTIIARMDADDFSFPNRLEKQVEILSKNPDISLVSCQTQIEVSDKNEGFQHYIRWQNSIISPEQHRNARFIESPIAHPTVMFRADLISQFGLYNSDAIPEDYEMWLRWLDAGVNFYKIPGPLLIWRDLPDRLSRNHPNYSFEAFDKVKMEYLAKWIKVNVAEKKEIIVCGGGKKPTMRAMMLQQMGINISAYNDVVEKAGGKFPFIAVKDLPNPKNAFIINLITKRGIGLKISKLLENFGYQVGKDYILAG